MELGTWTRQRLVAGALVVAGLAVGAEACAGGEQNYPPDPNATITKEIKAGYPGATDITVHWLNAVVHTYMTWDMPDKKHCMVYSTPTNWKNDTPAAMDGTPSCS